MEMGTAQSDVMRLARGARDGVEVELVPFIRYQRRRDIGIVVREPRSISHETLATARLRIRRRRLSQVPLTDLTILGTRNEQERR